MSAPVTAAAVPDYAAIHEEISAKHRLLEKNIGGYRTIEATNALTQALRYFEDNIRTERERLLQVGHIKTKEERAAVIWHSECFDQLLRLTHEVVLRSFAADNTDVGPCAPICALAILLSGHACKWRKFSGTRPDATSREWLHQIYRTAISYGVEGAVLNVRIEGRQFDATIESLYVRALLLDRFASGNLSPTRLELLDNWLVAWMGALWLTRAPIAGEPTLGVNTAATQRGFVPHVEGDGAHLFLSLRPVQRQLDKSIRQFHEGKIFPGWGIGGELRMEEHVAVIEFLERECNLIETASTPRGKRVSFGDNAIVGVFFGFDEICRLAFAAEKMHTLVGGGNEIGIRNAIRLVDVSEGGLGLDMTDEDARHVHVDDLVAVRLEKGRPCILGVVVRKSHLQLPTATLVGVKVISKQPVFRPLEHVDAANTWQPAEGIMVVGAADDGYADSVILSDKTYVANGILSLALAAERYTLRMRRVRQQGVGWRMVAFDAELTP